MALRDDTAEFLKEQLSGLGAVSVRRMFGGAGIYAGGVMFAIADDDVLYFKTDETTQPAYVAEGMGPFVYESRGRKVTTSFWCVPERLYDEPNEMATWARAALGVALKRAAAGKAPKSKRRN